MIDAVKFVLNMLKRFISVRIHLFFSFGVTVELYVRFSELFSGFCCRNFAYDT